MKHSLSIAIAAIGLLFVSACGSSDPAAAGPNFTAASGVITEAAATSEKNDLLAAAKFSFGAPSFVPGNVRTEDDDIYETAGCVTKTPGDSGLVDADSDNIKTQTRVYACNDIAGHHPGTTETRNGTVVVTDADDSATTGKDGGYEYNYDITGKYVQARGQVNEYTYRGFFKLLKDAASGAFTYSGDYFYSGSEANDGEAAVPYQGGGTWSWAVTPTDVTKPQDAGSVEISGFFGGYYYTSRSAPVNYVFKMSSSGLKYDKTCSQYYKEGTFTFEDGDATPNKIVITYACSSTTYKWNEKTL